MSDEKTPSSRPQEHWRAQALRRQFERLLKLHDCPQGHWAVIDAVPGGIYELPLAAVLSAGSEEDLARLGRITLLSERESGQSVLQNVPNRRDAGALASLNLTCGVRPRCLYDLEVLEGPEPPLAVGDMVRFNGRTKPSGGEVYVTGDCGERRYYLARECGGEQFECAWLQELEVLQRVEPDRDQRLPRRFDLATVQTIVIFNSVATTPEELAEAGAKGHEATW